MPKKILVQHNGIRLVDHTDDFETLDIEKLNANNKWIVVDSISRVTWEYIKQMYDIVQ